MNLNQKGSLKGNSDYPYLHQFSNDIGIDPKSLIRAYNIEKEFHKNILNATDPQKRKELYQDIYKKVHPIYNQGRFRKIQGNQKDKRVLMFKEELRDKSILDIGCGSGEFLQSIAKNIEHKDLVGLDIDISNVKMNTPNIRYICSDIIDFQLEQKFDIVFSDNVFEHISPVDIPSHINSIKSVLNPNGKLILIMPNRLFGPSDVTRIIDYSGTNKISAAGTHLNESTYSEMIPLLRQFGFKRFSISLSIPPFNGKICLCIDPTWLCWIENNPLFLKLIYSIKFKSRCRLNIPIILISEL